MAMRPAASAASVMRIASSSLVARGFSHNTCLPASISAKLVAMWTASGVAFTAASNAPHRRASSRLPKARAMPCVAA